ncbi:hypothetical protein ABPG73_019042 [Tetrahymena malaccensis]
MIMNIKFLQQIPQLALQTKEKVKSKIDQLKKEDSKYLTSSNLNRDQIIKGLESKNSQKVLDSLKRLLALSILGKSISKYVNKVILLLANPDIEIKRIIYILLTEISYENPNCDELLMCISPLLKQIASNIPSVIKGDTLKTLCSLTIQEMKPMLIKTLQKLHVDKSPYVKKISALTLLQFFLSKDIEEDEVDALYSFLLKDVSFLKGCVLHLSRQLQTQGDNLEFLHYHFRRVCKEIHTYTVYDIVLNLQMINKYALIYLQYELQAQLEQQTQAQAAAVEENKKQKPSSIKKVHPDLQLLYNVCTRLLYSSQPAIVIEIAHIAIDFPQPDLLSKVAKALLRFVNINSDSKLIILQAIEQFSIKYPQYFKNSYRTLFVTQLEKVYCKVKKIEILYHIVDDLNVGHILDELNYQIRSPSFDVSIAAINCIKKIAIKQNKFFGKCIKSLTSLLKTANQQLVEVLVKALSELIQQNINVYYPILSYTFDYYQQISNPLIKERVIIQISQFCQEIPSICLDYYRILLQTYTKEHDIVKLQIGNLGFKLLCIFDQNHELFQKLVEFFKYNLNLGINDRSFKVRDRMRFIKAITIGNEVSDIGAYDTQKLKDNLNKIHSQKLVDLSTNHVSDLFNSKEGQVQQISTENQLEYLGEQQARSFGLLTNEGFRIGTISSILKIRYEGYSNFEVFSAQIAKESTDQKRSEAETQEKLYKEQQIQEKLQKQKEIAEAQAAEESVITQVKPNPEVKQNQIKKQVQTDLLNHYQDSLKKTLSDFFEDD